MSDLHTNGIANRAPTVVQDDIVERLRRCPEQFPPYSVRTDAADEIERLRAERDAERALADQLADELTECWSFAREYAHSGQTPPPSLAAHEEARRG
jgi:hypothetical protein